MTTLHNENLQLYVLNTRSIIPDQRCTICQGMFNKIHKELVYYLGRNDLVTKCAAEYYGHEISTPFKNEPNTLVVLIHDQCIGEFLPQICVTKVTGDIAASFYIPKHQ